MPRIRLRRGEPEVARLPEGALAIPEPPAGYPTELADRFAIARYIVEQAVGDIDEEFVEEYYRGAQARLRYVPIEELAEGNEAGNQRVPARERRYAKLPAATRPPLVIQHGEIEDGNHRYRVAKAAGEKGLWCYEVVDAD